ncbi:MAG: hypothetical protein ACKESB_02700 [Candidatus Hodgkinia cicadicola]
MVADVTAVLKAMSYTEGTASKLLPPFMGKRLRPRFQMCGASRSWPLCHTSVHYLQKQMKAVCVMAASADQAAA